jgi:hypothetical protein
VGKKIVKERITKKSFYQKATRIPNETVFVKVFYSTIFKHLQRLKKCRKNATFGLMSNCFKDSVDESGCNNAEETDYAEQRM